MARLHELKIQNFRGIKNFSQIFGTTNLICIIGRGDSGKSTILEAISYVLSSSWNLTFFDSDFHNCDINNPIEIEATLVDLPDHLVLENKFGLHIRGIDKSTNQIMDELEDGHEKALTIKLEIKRDLEPKWYVINTRQEPVPISAYARAKLNVFMISDYVDRHFSWSKGNPLYSLLKSQQDSSDTDDNSLIIEALREAKNKIDNDSFGKFQEITSIVKSRSEKLGIDISNTLTSIDFKDISVKGGRVCLYDDRTPFRLKGKGSKRLISIAIQTAIADSGGIILIDEIEQGLEPDRVQHLVSTLKRDNSGQIFMTTHSRDAIVELETTDLYIMKKDALELTVIENSLQRTIRKNPEAFFANRIIVCEGATEIGICRALNSFRTQNGEKSASFLGVRFADGSGSQILDYCEGFKKSGFEVCLFCDSDDKKINEKKGELKEKGIKIIDWQNEGYLEKAIAKNIPFNVLKNMLKLAARLKSEETGRDVRIEKRNICSSIKEKYSKESPEKFSEVSDSSRLRDIIGDRAKENGWFKNISKGEELGNLIFENYEDIDENELKQKLMELSKWIDNDRL